MSINANDNDAGAGRVNVIMQCNAAGGRYGRGDKPMAMHGADDGAMPMLIDDGAMRLGLGDDVLPEGRRRANAMLAGK